MDTHFQESGVQVRQQSVHRGLGLPGVGGGSSGPVEELTRLPREMNYGRTAPSAPQIHGSFLNK